MTTSNSTMTNMAETALQGGGLSSSFYVEIQVQSKNERVIVDTGSSDLLVAEQSCLQTINLVDCDFYTADGAFSFLESQDYQDPCTSGLTYETDATSPRILDCYGTGYILSVAIKDDISVQSTPPLNASEVTMGAVEYWSNDFSDSSNDGIFGLAYSSLSQIASATGQPTALYTLLANNDMIDAFSLCFLSGQQSGGKMVFGGGYVGGMQLTPVISQGYYSVSMTSMSAGNTPISISSSVGVIIDSGTTLVELPSDYLSQVTSVICDDLMPYSLDWSFNTHSGCQNFLTLKQALSLTAAQIANCSDVTITLARMQADMDEVYLPITSADYWRGPSGISDYFFGFGDSGLNSGAGAMIVGDVALRDKFIYFNRGSCYLGFINTTDCTDSYQVAPADFTAQCSRASTSLLLNNSLLMICLILCLIFLK